MTNWLLWPFSIILALILFSLAIFIHELGHFLVARLLGLRADVFSIGFGPALWKRNIHGTELRISSIPFGGYVSLPQLDPDAMSKIQGKHGETNRLGTAAPWKRILVALAGPAGNIILAVFCAALICWFAPSDATGASTEIGAVALDSQAWADGLRPKDRILSVNERTVHSWPEFQTECFLAGSSNKTVRLLVERNGQEISIQTPLNTRLSEEEEAFTIGGLTPGPLIFGIGDVIPNSPAARAGLAKGDAILELNGVVFTHVNQLIEREHPERPITLTIQSFTEKETAAKRLVTIVPEVLQTTNEEVESSTKPLLGIIIQPFSRTHFQWMTERGVLAQLRSDAASVLRVLSALAAPKHEGERGRTAKSLGGPILIFGVLMQVVQVGLWVSLGFLRLICVNLAILNLLPLPVLDGGHILFALYAFITRREANARIIGWLTNIFACLLIGVMGWFLYSDTMRLILPAIQRLFSGD